MNKTEILEQITDAAYELARALRELAGDATRTGQRLAVGDNPPAFHLASKVATVIENQARLALLRTIAAELATGTEIDAAHMKGAGWVAN